MEKNLVENLAKKSGKRISEHRVAKTKQFPLKTNDYHVFVPSQEETSVHVTGVLLCECPRRH